jgi:cytochrome c oxidase accessory protein FixG
MNQQLPLKNSTLPSPNGAERIALYAARERIYTRAFHGFYRKLRLIGGSLLLALYFGSVWLNWHGHQAVWWNLPERKFYIFGATYWPQDFVLLSWLLIIAAFGLFFITVFAGRVWCGYTCPQSVWTWMFMWAEKVTEGDRNQRIKLDKSSLSGAKLTRKLVKHSIWLAVSLATGITFVGYFSPIRELVGDLVNFQVGGWALFWIGFFTLATYGNAGWLREQVCIHMCPYSRFQSVMFDQDTLIVSYDPRRGEARGPRKKTADRKALGLGDCIDCTLCVQVCPTGIDIRNGLQIACIGCAACVDACDSVMDKMHYPRGLVSYSTEHNLSGKKTHLLRPRLIGYALAMVVMMSLFGWAVASRPLVGLDVIKDRVLYRENALGQVENVYTLKIMNKSQRDILYQITADGLDGLLYEGRSEVRALAGEVLSVPVELAIDADKLPGSSNEITFHIRASDDQSIHNDTSSRFIGPNIR